MSVGARVRRGLVTLPALLPALFPGVALACTPAFKNAQTVESARYMIAWRTQPAPIAVGRHFHWFYPHPVNFELMQSGCALLIGEKSFKSFCLSEAEVNHYLCRVFQAEWVEREGVKIFEIHANRFLHNMVRALVGTFINLGRGKITLDDLRTILEKEDRKLAGFTAPAVGLFLEEVIY